MIKIWPDSLDVNYPGINNIYGPGSQSFVNDLVRYAPDDFEKASSLENCDCVMFPQFSNYVLAPYVFDKQKADYIAKLRKPIIIENTGGGIPQIWKESELGEYIWGAFSELIKVFFSVECYDWHRKLLPPKINYVSFDFVGFTEFGLGLREVPPLQSKEDYLKRTLDTSVAMNVYPPTRDVLWNLLNNNPGWHSFNLEHIMKGKRQLKELVGKKWRLP